MGQLKRPRTVQSCNTSKADFLNRLFHKKKMKLTSFHLKVIALIWVFRTCDAKDGNSSSFEALKKNLMQADYSSFNGELQKYLKSVEDRLAVKKAMHCESGEKKVKYTKKTGCSSTQSIQFTSGFSQTPVFQVGVSEARSDVSATGKSGWGPIGFKVVTENLNQKGAKVFTEVTNDLEKGPSDLIYKWMA